MLPCLPPGRQRYTSLSARLRRKSNRRRGRSVASRAPNVIDTREYYATVSSSSGREMPSCRRAPRGVLSLCIRALTHFVPCLRLAVRCFVTSNRRLDTDDYGLVTVPVVPGVRVVVPVEVVVVPEVTVL